MISTVDQLNEAIFVAYERNSVGFCFDPTRHTIIFFDGENDVTLTVNIQPLLNEIEAGNIKIHTECILEQLNAVHYGDEEDIIS